MALEPERGFVPDLEAIDEEVRAAGEADVPELPQQPDRRGRARRASSSGWSSSRAPTTSSSCTTTPTRRSPSTATARRRSSPPPAPRRSGIEVFSLSKGYNMTGWRCAVVVGNAEALADLLAAEDEHRLGPVRGGPAGRGRRALARGRRRGGLDERALPPPARPRLRRAARDRRPRAPAARHDLRVGAGARGLRRARPPTASTCSSRPPWCSRPGAIYGPAGEGWFRISLTTPDERLLEAVRAARRLAGGPRLGGGWIGAARP